MLLATSKAELKALTDLKSSSPSITSEDTGTPTNTKPEPAITIVPEMVTLASMKAEMTQFYTFMNQVKKDISSILKTVEATK